MSYTAGTKIQFKLGKNSGSLKLIFQIGELQKLSADKQGTVFSILIPDF